jgi:haloalkane dehalogenase
MGLRPISARSPFDADTIDDLDWRALFPRYSCYATINGQRLHYFDTGRGTPVVMVHGNPTWSFYYRRLARHLSSSFRVIVPDHIGCGLSARPAAQEYGYRLADRVADFTQFMATLNVSQPVDLVVHDWGGMIALAWAVSQPQQVRRLVLLNTAAFLPPGDKALPWQLHMLRNLPLLSTPLILYGNLFALGAAFMAPRKRLSKGICQGYLAPYKHPHNRLATLKFVQDIPLLPTDPSYNIVAQVEADLTRLNQKPILICWGYYDFVFDLDYLHQWQCRFPSARVYLARNAGHYVLEDAADQLLPRIDTFLKQLGC